MTTSHDRDETRFVSRLTRNTLALVLAGGRGSRLHELTQWRAKPSVHFGGQFRIIDFCLSNCVNSDIRQIGVLTQYKAHSLIRHLVHAWTGRFQSQSEYLEVLPASQRTDGHWYRGTADAIYQNLDIIRAQSPEFVLVLAGDHIYKMDYGPMLAAHVSERADMTVACVEVPVEEAAGAFGVMTVDGSWRVVGFDEKPASPASIPGRPGWCLASMGNYAFDTKFLYEQVIRDADNPRSHHDFGRDIIPDVIRNHRVLAYPFRDEAGEQQAYWRDVGTLDAFWAANIDLVSVTPELNLYDDVWPILTHRPQAPPAKFVFNEHKRRGVAVDSLVSEGCVLSGASVEKSLLFSNVRAHSYSRITESVVLPEVDIGRGCHVHRAIIDRGAILPDDTVIGYDHDADRARGFRVTADGVVLVTPDMLGQKLHFTR